MNGRSRLTRPLAAAKLALAAATTLFAAEYRPSHGPLASATPPAANSLYLVELNLRCAPEMSEKPAIPEIASILDSWAAHIRSETDRHLYRFRANPAEFDDSEAYFRMLIMAVVLYEDFGVRYNPDKISAPSPADSSLAFFADPRDIFLHGLLGPRRLGTCSSMPVLYVALGRRLGYPLKLVTTRSHLFVRWESPAEHLNLEATGKGINHYDDEHYKHWPFEVTAEEIREGGFLKPLSPEEEHALFLSLRGHCLRANGRDQEAIEAYRAAAKLAPNIRGYRLLLADALASQTNPTAGLSVRAVTQPPPVLARPVSAYGPPDPNPLRNIQ